MMAKGDLGPASWFVAASRASEKPSTFADCFSSEDCFGNDRADFP